MGQRVRWMKGFVQTCATHSRHPVRALRELGLFGFAGAVTMTFGTVVSAVFYPFLTAAALVMALASPPGADTTLPEALAFAASATLFALGLAAMIGPPAIGLRRRGLLRLWPYLPLLPFYYALVSVAAWLALVELAVDPFKGTRPDTARPAPRRRRQAMRNPLTVRIERSQAFAASAGSRLRLKLPTKRFLPSIR